MYTPRLIQNLLAQLTLDSFCFQNLGSQMGYGYDSRDQRKEEREREKKTTTAKVSSTCHYTHQTLLIRQQQNFINRMDIIE